MIKFLSILSQRINNYSYVLLILVNIWVNDKQCLNTYLFLSLLIFIGIIFCELQIHPSHFLRQLYAETLSFALLVKDDKFALLDQKTKFLINDSKQKVDYIYMDYYSRMIIGDIPIDPIERITIISGNKAAKFAVTGTLVVFLFQQY